MPHELSKPFHDWLVDLRRDFHRFPELSYQEKKTAARICDVLKHLDVPFHSDVAGTGILARLRAKHSGPVIAFRADMDALPLEEANDVPYKSRHPGCMHACGHDAHMTIALGIIRWLQESDWVSKGSGEILFIFQPAEEKGAGAKAMLESGIFDEHSVQAVFAGHMVPELPVGHVGILPEQSHAATNPFAIHLKGKGGHGAHPEQCTDPIVAGSHLVTQLQVLVSRELSPLDSAVVTIGSFHAGGAGNVIPEDALLEGTIRSLTPEIRRQTLERFQQMLKGIETSFNVTAALDLRDGYPVVINDKELTAHVKTCAESFLGAEQVHMQMPSMGGEDFSYFCSRWKGVMVDIGCHSPEKGFQYGLHSPRFDLDERVLDTGTLFFSRALMTYLQKIPA